MHQTAQGALLHAGRLAFSGSLALFLAASSGRAQNAPEFPTSQLLTGEMRDLLQVECFDLDGDGVNDLVGYSDAFDALLWQRGDGSAPLGPRRFGPPEHLLDVPGLTESVFEVRLFEVADVTGDGLDDLILSNRPARALQLIENLGGGSVAAPVTIFDTTPMGGNLLAAGSTALDYDGDGDQDLAVFAMTINGGSSSTALLENLGGGFAARPLPPNPSPGYFAAADLDGDGDLDLASPSHANGWLRNDSGVFTLTLLPSKVIPSETAIARDFDGDGDVDLGFETRSASVLTLYENLDGMGNFGPPSVITRPRESVAFIDMDGDGDLDLLHEAPSADRLNWTALEPGLTAGSTSLFVGRVGLVAFLAAVDLDADGVDDVLVRDESRGQSCYRGQTASGQLSLDPAEVDVSMKISDQGVVGAGDLDLDGHLDLIVTQFNVGVQILYLDAVGAIDRSELLASSPGRVQEVEVVDLDRDGRLDVLLVALTGPISVYFGQPGGTFGGPLEPDGGGRYASVEAIDLDQDGDLDIVGGGSIIGDRNLVALDQIAPGQFSATPRVLTTFNGSVYSVETADLDLDGIDDLCVSATNANLVPRHFLCRSVGDGTIERTLLQQAFDDQPLLPVDLDGDGDSDFVWIGNNNARLLARENLGGGAVSDPITFLETGRRLSEPALTQLNTDGIPDLLVLQLDGPAGGPRVFRSLSQGYLDYGPLEAIGGSDPGVRRLLAVDFDDDMDSDVFGFVSTAGSIELYESTLFGDLGISECGPAVPNSTGTAGELALRGSAVAQVSALRILATRLPAASLTLFLTSQTPGFVVGPGGSTGNLCLGGSIGRFLAPGAAQISDAAGSASLDVNLRELPQPAGAVSATAGQTWRFQAWHRDVVSGQTTSNFTQAVRVQLL